MIFIVPKGWLLECASVYAIGTAFCNNTVIGLILGMLAGLVIGSCIEKKVMIKCEIKTATYI